MTAAFWVLWAVLLAVSVGMLLYEIQQAKDWIDKNGDDGGDA